MQLDPNLAGTLDVVKRAISSAQLQVESLLHSKLGLVQQDSQFFLDSQAFSGIQPGGYFRLELPSGFVDPTTLVVTYGNSWLSNTYVSADNTIYQLDAAKGYLLMDAPTYRDAYVRVQCTTGFAPNVPTPAFAGLPSPYDSTVQYVTGAVVTFQGTVFVAVQSSLGASLTDQTNWTPVTYAPAALPQDLYEAVVALVPSVVISSQINSTDGASALGNANIDVARAHRLLEPYIRLKGFSFRPL